jgi:hypothetical protein
MGLASIRMGVRSLLLANAPWCSLCGAFLPVLLAPRWCSGVGVDEGATAVASKRSRHEGGSNNRVPTAAACALVTSLMAVR